MQIGILYLDNQAGRSTSGLVYGSFGVDLTRSLEWSSPRSSLILILCNTGVCFV